MPGSMDNHDVRVINVTDECHLAVLIDQDGKAEIISKVTKDVAAATLRTLADIIEAGGVGGM